MIPSAEATEWPSSVAGSGQPLILLHNGGGTRWNWIYQIEFFAATQRVIAPDLPGFGVAPRPATPLTLDYYVRGLERLIAQLGGVKPLLVGNCIGAAIALEYALRHPQNVERLVLVNVCGGPPMLPPSLRWWVRFQPRHAILRQIQRAILDLSGHPWAQQFGAARLLYAAGEPPLPAPLRQVRQAQLRDRQQRASFYWLVRGLASFARFSGPLPKPTPFPPTLLAWGAQNRTLAPEWAQRIAGWLHPDEFWLIERAGHMPMYEQPALVNQRLAAFFAQSDCAVHKENT